MKIKWYHICCIAFPFVRVIDIPHGGELVPKFAYDAHVVDGVICGYTYQMMWYFLWMRMIELAAYYTIFKHTKHPIFVFTSILCIGKILDEKTNPFTFQFPEFVAWLIAIVGTSWYLYEQRRDKART